MNNIKKNNDFPFDYDIENLLEANFQNFSMFVTQRYKNHYVENKYEEFSSDIFLNLVKEDSIVVDIGANYGYYALLASTKNKKGKTYAIEPVKENFDVLNKNVHKNGFSHLETLNYAISDLSGEKEFNVTEASDSAGFYEHPNTKTYEKRIVQVKSLDDLFINTKVDVLKIDTEGHELHVLAGMKKIISSNDDLRILIEFNPKCLENANANPEDMLNKIWSSGFDIFLIKENERFLCKLREGTNDWKNIFGNLEYANLLCVKKEKSLFISFVSHSASKGGAERALLEVIDGLIDKGMICNIVLPGIGPLVDEIRKRPVGISVTPYDWWAWMKKEKFFRDEKLFTQQITSLASVLYKINPDVIISNTGVIDAGAVVAGILGIPHIWHIHEFGEIDHHLNFLLEKTERAKYINEHSDLVLFNSNAVQKYYQPEVLPIKSKIVFNNVKIVPLEKNNPEKFFKNDNAWKFLILGAINPGKGQKDAVLAVKDLSKKSINIELLIVGQISNPDYCEGLKLIITENNLENHIKIYDYMDNPVSILQQADALLVCSENEAFGRVTAEAMLLKKPVIATRSGGSPEIVSDQKSGLLYNPGNILELTEKIEELFQDKSLRRSYGEFGFQWAKEQFDFEVCFGRVIPTLYSLKNSNKINSLDRFILKDIKNLHKAVQQKDQEIINLNQVVQKKVQEVQQKDREIDFMKSSKFWRLRTVYMRIKSLF